MKAIKVGRHIFVRHWFKWYSVHQAFGGSPNEETYLTRVDFPEESE